MNDTMKWGAYIGATLMGLVIYWVLSTYTGLEEPWPFAIAALFVVIDIVSLRWLFSRLK